MADGTISQADVTLGTDKAQTPKTISWEEHQKVLRDSTTAVKADVGRFQAEAQKALKAAQAAEERVQKLVKQQEEAELEAARDDPDRLTGIRERQKRRQTESELEAARQELNEKTSKLTAYESRDAETARETKARDIAARLNVNPATLIKMSKFTDGTPEAIEEIAKELPRGTRSGFRPDSNMSVGGGSSREQIIAAYTIDPRDPAAKEAYMDLRRKERR